MHDADQHIFHAALKRTDQICKTRVAHLGTEVRESIGTEILSEIARVHQRLVQHLLLANQISLQETTPQDRREIGARDIRDHFVFTKRGITHEYINRCHVLIIGNQAATTAQFVQFIKQLLCFLNLTSVVQLAHCLRHEVLIEVNERIRSAAARLVMLAVQLAEIAIDRLNPPNVIETRWIVRRERIDAHQARVCQRLHRLNSGAIVVENPVDVLVVVVTLRTNLCAHLGPIEGV